LVGSGLVGSGLVGSGLVGSGLVGERFDAGCLGSYWQWIRQVWMIFLGKCF
jgi:hypothetical protein